MKKYLLLVMFFVFNIVFSLYVPPINEILLIPEDNSWGYEEGSVVKLEIYFDSIVNVNISGIYNENFICNTFDGFSYHCSRSIIVSNGTLLINVTNGSQGINEQRTYYFTTNLNPKITLSPKKSEYEYGDQIKIIMSGDTMFDVTISGPIQKEFTCSVHHNNHYECKITSKLTKKGNLTINISNPKLGQYMTKYHFVNIKQPIKQESSRTYYTILSKIDLNKTIENKTNLTYIFNNEKPKEIITSYMNDVIKKIYIYPKVGKISFSTNLNKTNDTYSTVFINGAYENLTLYLKFDNTWIEDNETLMVFINNKPTDVYYIVNNTNESFLVVYTKNASKIEIKKYIKEKQEETSTSQIPISKKKEKEPEEDQTNIIKQITGFTINKELVESGYTIESILILFFLLNVALVTKLLNQSIVKRKYKYFKF